MLCLVLGGSAASVVDHSKIEKGGKASRLSTLRDAMLPPYRDHVDILVEKTEFGLRSWTISTAARKIVVLKIYPDGPDAGLLDGEGALPEGVIWIDLLNPSAKEIAFVEQKAKVHVPSREDLSEIEVSSRLAKEGNHLYLSAPVIGHATLEHAELSPAGFIVGKDLLITIRFENLPTFDAVVERLRHDKMLTSGFGVFIALLEAIVDAAPMF